MNAKTMRKTSVAFAIAIAMTSAVQAQNEGRSVRLGLSIAPNLGWIKPTGKLVESDGSRLGFRFGLMTDFLIGKNANYAFATGIYMNNVGFKYARDYGYTTTTVQVNGPDTTTITTTHTASEAGIMKLQYVEIPISIKLKTNEIGYMTYFGQLGFDTGFRVAAKGDYETVRHDGTVKLEDEDAKDNAAELRVALLVGAGFEYNFSGNTSALVGLKYSNGFTNVFDNDDLGQAKLHYAELTLGVLF